MNYLVSDKSVFIWFFFIVYALWTILTILNLTKHEPKPLSVKNSREKESQFVFGAIFRIGLLVFIALSLKSNFY